MEDANMSIEDLIANVLDDISIKGYSSVQPFVVGEVEERMIEFAKVNEAQSEKEFNGKRYVKIETDCNRD